jgi:predicted adenylyl cyclase CyaB
MENIEIEIKLSITKKQFLDIKKRLVDEDANCSVEEQKDIYFSPKSINFFKKGDECLRIRIENSKNSLNYKRIFFGENELDTHIKEYATGIEDTFQMIQILKYLNIQEILTVHKVRYKYLYGNQFEISLDEVTDLGCFVEIEVIENTNVQQSNRALIEIVNRLGLDINQKNTVGYSNMMYEKIIGR